MSIPVDRAGLVQRRSPSLARAASAAGASRPYRRSYGVSSGYSSYVSSGGYGRYSALDSGFAGAAERSRRYHRRPRSHAPNVLKRAAVAGGLLLAAVFSTGAALDTAYHDRVLPGVRFEAQPLTGLSASEVKDLLDVQRSAYMAAPAVFVYGDREWHPNAAEIGLRIDTDAMARDALAHGRQITGGAASGVGVDAIGAVARWPQVATTPLRTSEVGLQAAVDAPQLAAFLSAVAAEVDRSPVNAGISIRNGQVVTGQSAAGQRVDIPATLARVRAPKALGDVQRVEVSVVTTPPALSDAHVADAVALATKMLASPLTLRAAGKSWSLTPAALGAMIDFKRADVPAGGPDTLAAVLNEAKVAAYVKTLAAQVDKPASNAQLRWTGSGVAASRESSDGLKLDQPAAVKAIIAQAPLDQRDVALTVTVIKPTVGSDDLAQLGIKELISTGTSKFAGSAPERVTNIQVAAARLNGTVIPAGATFSFLDSLGPITRENGYKEGLTIQGDETVPGIGGGVCQVSTTAFRAAFFAGLPIVERHQHSYRVSYYEQDGSPVGFDAAVYDPGVDLRFRNDTGAAILIQTGVDTGSSTLAFRFYGTASGREVKLAASKANEVAAGPRLPDGTDPKLPKGVRKQVEWKSDGVDATIRRTVLAGGQVTLNDSFFSRYVPWQEKWVVGTGPAA